MLKVSAVFALLAGIAGPKQRSVKETERERERSGIK